jgi:hypothetical protein
MDTKSLKKLITKAKNNGKKHIRHFSQCYQMILEEYDDQFKFKDIKLHLGELPADVHGCAELIDYQDYHITINKNLQDENMIWETLTHELAHVFDYHVARRSNHDLVFIHNWAILSGFKINILEWVYNFTPDFDDDSIDYKHILKHDTGFSRNSLYIY